MRIKYASRLSLLLLAFVAAMILFPAMAFAETVAPDGTTSASMPTIQSDKADYAPGELVTLTGSNWQPGESVNIVVNDTYGASWSRNVEVTADENGEITDTFNLPNWFVSDYDVTATGAQSGSARTTFTDTIVQATTNLPATDSTKIAWDVYNNTTCTAPSTSGGPPGGVLVPGGVTLPIATTTNTQSVRLTADAVSVGNRAFNNWTGPGGGITITVLSPNSVCVAGFNNGNDRRTITANYASAPTNQAPTANAGGPYSVNEGGTVQLNGSGTDTDGTIASYAWDLDNNGTFETSGQNPNFSAATIDGPASRTVVLRVTDNGGATATSNATVNVANVAPTATLNAPNSVNEGSDINLSLTSPSDPSSADTAAGFTYAFDCGSGYGSFGSSSTATCSTNDNGTRAVKAKIRDKDGGEREYTASVTVNNVPPTAVDDSPAAVAEGGSVTLNVLANDTDPAYGNDPLSVTANSNGQHGTVVCAAGGSCTYTPNDPDFFGTDSFTYTVSDGDGGTDEGKVNVEISAVNDAPVADDDSYNTNEDNVLIINAPGVLGNDTDVDNANLTATKIGEPSHGNVTLNNDGSFTYTPAANYHGPDSFMYKASDGAAQSNEAVVDITVNPVNDAPSVGNITGDATADEGQSKDYSVTATDVDGDTLTYAWTVKSGAATITGGASSDTATVKFLDGPDNVNLEVVVSDGHGDQVTKNLDGNTVSVANVKPSTTLDGPSLADEDTTKTYNYTVSDPGDDTHTVTTACGSAGTKVPGSDSYSATSGEGSFDCHFPNGDATTNVTAIVQDSDGASDTDNQQVTVQVVNVPPVVTAAGNQSANEGENKGFDLGSFADPGANDGPWHVTLDWGDGSDPTTFDAISPGELPQKSHTYADEGTFTVDVKVAEAGSGDTPSDTKTFQVTVANVKPSIALTGDATADEGQTKTYTYAVTDPGANDTHTATTDCGTAGDKVSGSDTYSDTTKQGSFKCYFPNGPDTTNVTAKVTDNDGASDTDNQQVTVQVVNVAPTVSISGADAANEGDTRTYDFTVTDPGATDAFTIKDASCGTGGDLIGAPSTNAGGGSFTCRFPDGPGSPNVSIQVTDSDGADSNVASKSVTVSNVAPTTTLSASNPLSADEGQTKTYTYTVSDPGVDTYTVEESCGDNGIKTDTAEANGFDCTFPDGPATSTVSAQATDSDNDQGNEDTQSVTVNNVAPNVTLDPDNDQNVDEGTTHTYSYTVSDPGDDTFIVADTYPKCGTGGNLVSGSSTTTATGGSFDCAFPDGPATTDVAIKVADTDGASDTDSESVQIVAVANVSPTLTAPAGQSSNEGESKSFGLGSFTDPGSDSPWAVEVDWGDGSANETFDASSAGSLGSRNHTYADNGTYTVSVKVTDKDGESDTETFQVTVNNVKPSVTKPADTNAVEGTSKSFGLGSFSDPGVNDGPWKVKVDWGDGSAVQDLPDQTSQGSLGMANHAYANNGSYSMSVTVTDKDGASDTQTSTITVANANPVVTAPADQTASEGTAKSFDLGSFSDAGANDNPWKVKVDWGDGSPVENLTDKSTQGSLGNLSHKYDDNGAFTVTVSVTDKDGETGSATFKANVANVNPTANFTNDSPVNEGSSFTLSMGGADDVSAADKAAGFTFAFDCGGGYGAFGSSNNASCPTNDSGTRAVKAKIRDKDGGVNEYTANVTVNNVAPTITSLTPSPLQALIGQPVSFTGAATDPSSVDTTAGFSWQWSKDGGAYAAGNNPFSTTFSSCGAHTVSAKATDKDEGTSAPFSTSASVQVYNGTYLPPLKPSTDNLVQKGQVVPVKISVASCDGINKTGLVPDIRLLSGDPTPNTNETDYTVPTSVSSADSSGVMRPVDGGYIYNLRVPNDTTVKAGAKYYIRVSPFGIASGQHMIISIQIRK